MNQNYRKERLDELLRQELNSIVLYELSDPRLIGVSVSHVDTTRDLQVARVYVSLLDEETDAEEAIEGLQNAKGFMRRQIALRVQLRRVPDFYFQVDTSLKEARRIDEILDNLPPPIEDTSEGD